MGHEGHLVQQLESPSRPHSVGYMDDYDGRSEEMDIDK